MLNLPAPRFPISDRSAIPKKAQKNEARALPSSGERPKTSGPDWFPSSVKRPNIRNTDRCPPAIGHSKSDSTPSPRADSKQRAPLPHPPGLPARIGLLCLQTPATSFPLPRSELRCTPFNNGPGANTPHSSERPVPAAPSPHRAPLPSPNSPRRSASAQKAFLLTERTKKGRPQRRPFLENTSTFRSRGRNDILFRQDP